ncbi:MAG: amidase, partial [Myxococcales bacterium]|nr:amidase [Myxococcales bacterium]
MHSRSVLDLTALEQAALIRERAISSCELTEGYLRRIERANPALQAFVDVFADRALRAARAVDRRTPGDGPRPTFHGVPLGIKDTDPVRFSRNRAGSRAYRRMWVPFDAPSVRALRGGGFVILGKTATSEFAILPVVETDLHPPTVNPWALSVTAGGSSGGAAAAVASGLLPIAHAADGGGSIRIPAAFCGLFGFKASRGLTPDFYAAMEPLGISVTGAVTHSVDDCAAFLDVLCGQATHPPAPASLLVRSRGAAPQRRTIGLWLRSIEGEVDPEIAATVEETARALAAMGHTIKPIAPVEGSVDEFLPLFQRLSAGPPTLGEGSLQPVTRWLREAGRKVSLETARALRDTIARRVLAWFGELDFVLSPTVGRAPPRVGELARDTPEAQFKAAAELGLFTAIFNVSGQPSASVPVGLSGAGLPIGAMITGRQGDDVALLQLCRALEEARPWRARRAPLARELAAGDAAHSGGSKL